MEPGLYASSRALLPLTCCDGRFTGFPCCMLSGFGVSCGEGRRVRWRDDPECIEHGTVCQGVRCGKCVSVCTGLHVLRAQASLLFILTYT